MNNFLFKTTVRFQLSTLNFQLYLNESKEHHEKIHFDDAIIFIHN